MNLFYRSQVELQKFSNIMHCNITVYKQEIEYLDPRNSAILIVFFYDDTLECLCWRYDKQSLFMVYLHCIWDDEEQNILSMSRFCVAFVIQILQFPSEMIIYNLPSVSDFSN